MKPMNKRLLTANTTSEALVAMLRGCHSDAIKSKNQFAEIVMFQVLKEATELQSKIARALLATGPYDE